MKKTNTTNLHTFLLKNLHFVLIALFLATSGFVYLYNSFSATAFVAIQEPSDGGGGSGGYVGNGSSITVKIFAVVCEAESDLPNLDYNHPSYNGKNSPNYGSPTVTEAYLNSFLSTHPKCKTEDGWSFRYGKGEATQNYNPQPSWSGWSFTSPTSNGVAIIQRTTSYLDDKWVEDYNDPKNSHDANGNTLPYTYEEQNSMPYIATTMIKEPRLYVSMYRGPGTYSNQTQYNAGGYVPDGYTPFSTYNNPYPWDESNPQRAISAELRCYDNHVGYNNYSYVRLPQGGITYTCLFFTAKPPTPATLNVATPTPSECSAAGLNWSITPGNLSGSGTSGSYTIQPSSGGDWYTIFPTGSSQYTYSVRNSKGGGSGMLMYGNDNETFNVSCTPNECPPPVTQQIQCGSGYQNPNDYYTQTTTYGPSPSCPANAPTSNKSSICIPTITTLPACRVDSFPDQWESNGVVTPTWGTTYSNDVVLSGGQFGAGIPVESDGFRSIYINADTVLTITANSGATTCYPSASRSATMHADVTVPMCTYPGEEYLTASDPNCGPTQTCSITYFPDDGEDGNGWTYPQWQSNADYLTLNGGPFNNTPVQAPNHTPDSTVRMAITTNTILTLTGNGGQCSDSALFYATPPPGKPDPFTGVAGSCGSGLISLSWGQSPGVGSYVLERDGARIWEGGNYGNGAFTDTGRATGVTYNYKIYGTSPNGNTLPNTVSVTAPAACPIPPTATLSANPTNVNYDAGTTLTWSSTQNATSCTASGGWSGTKASAGTQSVLNIRNNTTFNIYCTGPGGTGSQVSATVNVGPSSPTGFTVAPTSCGNNWLSLSWYPPSAGGAPTNYKVYRDGGATPIYNGNGSDIQLGGGAMGFSDTSLGAGTSHNYTVTASNAAGVSVPASASGTVTASCTPTATLSANPTSVSYNSASTLTWSSTNATSCTASGDWNGAKALSGSTSTGPLISDKTYTLTCANAGINSAPISATVTVGSAPMSGTLTPQTTSCVISAGSSSCNINYSWTTTNPVATSAVTKPVNVTVATGNSGTNVPFAVKYNTETFYLYNSGVELANSTVTSSCASGSSWNGSICYAAPTFDYSLVQPQGVVVTKGSTDQFGQNIVGKTLTSGTGQPVSLSLSGLPANVTASVANQNCTPDCSSTITYTVSPSASTGVSMVTINASPLSKSTWFYLTINPPAAMTVSCSVNPSTGGKVGQTISWSTNVMGGTAPFTYAWSGTGVPSPSPTTASFNTTYSTTGTKTAQVTVTDSLGTQATCPAVNTIINFDPTIIEF